MKGLEIKEASKMTQFRSPSEYSQILELATLEINKKLAEVGVESIFTTTDVIKIAIEGLITGSNSIQILGRNFNIKELITQELDLLLNFQQSEEQTIKLNNEIFNLIKKYVYYSSNDLSGHLDCCIPCYDNPVMDGKILWHNEFLSGYKEEIKKANNIEELVDLTNKVLAIPIILGFEKIHINSEEIFSFILKGDVFFRVQALKIIDRYQYSYLLKYIKNYINTYIEKLNSSKDVNKKAREINEMVAILTNTEANTELLKESKKYIEDEPPLYEDEDFDEWNSSWKGGPKRLSLEEIYSLLSRYGYNLNEEEVDNCFDEYGVNAEEVDNCFD